VRSKSKSYLVMLWCIDCCSQSRSLQYLLRVPGTVLVHYAYVSRLRLHLFAAFTSPSLLSLLTSHTPFALDHLVDLTSQRTNMSTHSVTSAYNHCPGSITTELLSVAASELGGSLYPVPLVYVIRQYLSMRKLQSRH
jgi:hypothetical protein